MGKFVEKIGIMGRKDKERMYRLLEVYAEGKVSRKELLEREGIKPSTFQYWWKRYRDEVSTLKGDFVRMEVEQEGSMEIILQDGIRIRFDQLVPVRYLAQILTLK